jgi:ElaB/YqjD/DUF883 family membrane-anchored ribosome-binding protein
MPMADRVYPNNETRFPAYPEPGAGPPLDEPRYHPNFAPAARAQTRSNLALNNAAERVGNMVSSAVERVKELPDRLQYMKERFTVIRGRAQEDLATRAGDVADDLRLRARSSATRAERLARENPLGFIAGAAGLGFVLGFALRIWRDHADE